MAGVHRTYVGRLERGESGVTVDSLAAILAALGDLRRVLSGLRELALCRPGGKNSGDHRAKVNSLLTDFP